MKPQLTIAHEGTLGDEDRTRFKFHEESIAHIMRVLTDLYENPELAVIREYSTNARDAHIAAGKADVPIRVTLPTALDSTFIVRDEGLGLSREEIVTNLTQYGYSSKRDTDAEVGMLGLGSKSALTYTSQFTYVACKDGKTVTVLITREDDGAPVLQVVDEMDTPDDPNFVEVHVPVKNSTLFIEAARKFFWYWEPGTVLINGKAPEGDETIWSDHYQEELWLSEDVVLIQAARYGGSKATVVMGNVPYRLAPDQAPEVIKNLSGYELYAFVDVGSVDFTPSRESLMMSKRTRECIATLDEFVGDRLYTALVEKLDGMEYKEANDWARERQGLCRAMWERGSVLKCKGRMLSFDHSMPIPHASKSPNGAWSVNLNRPRWGGADRAEAADYIHFARPPRVVVYGYNSPSGVPGDVKQSIRHYVAKNNLTNTGNYYETALLINAKLADDVMEAIGKPPQVHIDEVHTKVRQKRASSKAIETRYRMVDPDSTAGWRDVHELDYRPDCFVAADAYRENWTNEQARGLARAGHRVAVVWGRNKKWFEENYGNVPTMNVYAQWWGTVKVPELKAQLGDVGRHRLHRCDSSQCSDAGRIAAKLGEKIELIHDEELVYVLKICLSSQRPSPVVDRILGSQRAMRQLGHAYSAECRSPVCESIYAIWRRLPILDMLNLNNMMGRDMDELVRIINLAYAPPAPSTELVVWDSPSNPNRPKATITYGDLPKHEIKQFHCTHQPTPIHEGALL